jgi:hypothetical protein
MDKKSANQAIKVGDELVAAVLKSRTKALKMRAASLRGKAKPQSMKFIAGTQPPRLLGGAMGNNGVLVAEGDSWFDYPLNDVLSCLEDEHGYDVESVAHKGDRVENMAYADGQLTDLSRLIEKLIRQGITPKAILLSGGGNDIAGDEFGMLLNHKKSAISGLNDKIFEGVMDRISHAYVTIIWSVMQLCRERLGKEIPILVHGYDYPIPDGRGFMGGWGPLPGPWLEPGFREKGFEELTERITIMTDLIDRFNLMLENVASLQQFAGNVAYVNLRGSLKNGTTYKKDWANELHPTKDGFSTVTKKFASVLSALPGLP